MNIILKLIHGQRGIAHVSQPGHLVAEGTHRSGGGGMTKTGVLFIAQDVVVGNDRNAVIRLCVQRANIGQTLTDANLIPGLIEAVFQLVNHRITQVLRQRTKRRTADIRRVVDRGIFPGDQVLIAQRLV